MPATYERQRTTSKPRAGLCRTCRVRPTWLKSNGVWSLLCTECGENRRHEHETDADLDALVAEQRPTMRAEKGEPKREPPPVEKRPSWAERNGAASGQWRQWDEQPALTLHHSTEPAAILAKHRRLVAAAVRHLGERATVARISRRTCLPAWCVERALETMKGEA